MCVLTSSARYEIPSQHSPALHRYCLPCQSVGSQHKNEMGVQHSEALFHNEMPLWEVIQMPTRPISQCHRCISQFVHSVDYSARPMLDLTTLMRFAYAGLDHMTREEVWDAVLFLLRCAAFVPPEAPSAMGTSHFLCFFIILFRSALGTFSNAYRSPSVLKQHRFCSQKDNIAAMSSLPTSRSNHPVPVWTNRSCWRTVDAQICSNMLLNPGKNTSPCLARETNVTHDARCRHRLLASRQTAICLAHPSRSPRIFCDFTKFFKTRLQNESQEAQSQMRPSSKNDAKIGRSSRQVMSPWGIRQFCMMRVLPNLSSAYSDSMRIRETCIHQKLSLVFDTIPDIKCQAFKYGSQSSNKEREKGIGWAGLVPTPIFSMFWHNLV